MSTADKDDETGTRNTVVVNSVFGDLWNTDSPVEAKTRDIDR